MNNSNVSVSSLVFVSYQSVYVQVTLGAEQTALNTKEMTKDQCKIILNCCND